MTTTRRLTMNTRQQTTLAHNEGVRAFWEGKPRDGGGFCRETRTAWECGFDKAQMRHDDELLGLDTENTK
jgi:hypothetical protein